MIDFLAWFDLGDATALGAAVVLLQITAVIALAAAAARWLCAARRRHTVWLAALGCVLASPIIAVVAGRLGLALLRIELPGRPPVAEARPDGGRGELEPIPVPTAPSVSADAPRRKAKRRRRRLHETCLPRRRAKSRRRRCSCDPAPRPLHRRRRRTLLTPGARPGRIVPGVGRRRRLPVIAFAARSASPRPLAARRPAGRRTASGRRLGRGSCRAWRQDSAADPPLAARFGAVGRRRPASVRPLAGGVDRFAGRPPAPRRFDPRMRSICCGATRSSACCNAWPSALWPHPLLHYLNRRLARARRFATTTC